MNILCIQKITKRFGGIAAVNNCTLEVKKGTITALIGPNGAGKTTLFNIISGLYQADKGTILFEQKKLAEESHMIARNGISRTFQLTRLFKNLSIRDNLLVAKKTATKQELAQIMKAVRLDKPLSTLCGSLSYGQQRLVELARALLFPHSLLLLDEPTAGVNPAVRKELKIIIRNAQKNGTTILLIEHDMEFVMDLSNHIIVLAEGTVLAQGTPASIRKNKKVLEAYLGK